MLQTFHAMISAIVLVITSVLFLLISIVVGRAIINHRQIIGRPPVPVFFFVLAKMLVIVNLAFLLLKGLNISVYRIFNTTETTDIIALVFLLIGTTFLILSTVALNTDLIFGLSSSGDHKLQTKGVFSISRHPFYLGFIFILFSSCLFNPHYINFIAFIGAWIIHHFIMIKEEQFLAEQYGEEYVKYAKKVNRYITIQLFR